MTKRVGIQDMVYVRQVERQLGRRISDEERAVSWFDGYVELMFPNGRWEKIIIPILVFPDQLLSAECLGSLGRSIE